MTGLFDMVLAPLSALSPTVQAFLIGIPGALLALTVFRYVSNQDAIEREKDQIKAHLFELRLYRDDLRVSLAAQGQILRHNLSYLRQAFLPMAVMIVPFLLLLAQVEARFGHRSLEVGESAVLSVGFDNADSRPSGPVQLELASGISVETPPLRIRGGEEVIWRVSGNEPGRHTLVIRVGDAQLKKQVFVSEPMRRLATNQYQASDWRTLLYPGEPALESGPTRSISLAYPFRVGSFAGLSTASWIFMGSSILFGFLLRRFFGVTF